MGLQLSCRLEGLCTIHMRTASYTLPIRASWSSPPLRCHCAFMFVGVGAQSRIEHDDQVGALLCQAKAAALRQEVDTKPSLQAHATS